MQDQFVKTCPYCGGKEVAEARHNDFSAESISVGALKLKTAKLYFAVCLNCGSVVRTYVKESDVKKLR